MKGAGGGGGGGGGLNANFCVGAGLVCSSFVFFLSLFKGLPCTPASRVE